MVQFGKVQAAPEDTESYREAGQTPVSPASFDHHLSLDFTYAYLYGYLYLPNEGSYKSWVYHENFVSMYELEQKKKSLPLIDLISGNQWSAGVENPHCKPNTC